jgi:hypothetical protein
MNTRLQPFTRRFLLKTGNVECSVSIKIAPSTRKQVHWNLTNELVQLFYLISCVGFAWLLTQNPSLLEVVKLLLSIISRILSNHT